MTELQIVLGSELHPASQKHESIDNASIQNSGVAANAEVQNLWANDSAPVFVGSYEDSQPPSLFLVTFIRNRSLS